MGRKAGPLVVVLHGPSLSALGTREPELYGTLTLAALDRLLRARGAALGLRVQTRQSNHEGVLIDAILAAPGKVDGILLNAGAYAHTSLAIADAIRAVTVPVVEVHLTNTAARDPARHPAPVGAACVGRIEGFGAQSYLLGLEALRVRFSGPGPVDRRAKAP